MANLSVTKTELFFLHVLMSEIRKDVEQQGISVDASEYKALDVSPLDPRASKKSHEKAVKTLSSSLVESIEQTPLQPAT